MLHEATKQLILKLAEMTRQQKLVWSETSSGVFRYETEGYQVHVTQNPVELLLTDLAGREVERADVHELAESETDAGESFTRVVASLRKEVARQVRGTDAAIASILAGLDLDGDGAPETTEAPEVVETAGPDLALVPEVTEELVPDAAEELVEDVTAQVTEEVAAEEGSVEESPITSEFTAQSEASEPEATETIEETISTPDVVLETGSVESFASTDTVDESDYIDAEASSAASDTITGDNQDGDNQFSDEQHVETIDEVAAEVEVAGAIETTDVTAESTENSDISSEVLAGATIAAVAGAAMAFGSSAETATSETSEETHSANPSDVDLSDDVNALAQTLEATDAVDQAEEAGEELAQASDAVEAMAADIETPEDNKANGFGLGLAGAGLDAISEDVSQAAASADNNVDAELTEAVASVTEFAADLEETTDSGIEVVENAESVVASQIDQEMEAVSEALSDANDALEATETPDLSTPSFGNIGSFGAVVSGGTEAAEEAFGQTTRSVEETVADIADAVEENLNADAPTEDINTVVSETLEGHTAGTDMAEGIVAFGAESLVADISEASTSVTSEPFETALDQAADALSGGSSLVDGAAAIAASALADVSETVEAVEAVEGSVDPATTFVAQANESVAGVAADFASTAKDTADDMVSSVTANIFGDVQPSVTDDVPSQNDEVENVEKLTAKKGYEQYNPWS